MKFNFFLLLIIFFGCTSPKKATHEALNLPKPLVLTVILEAHQEQGETIFEWVNTVKAPGHVKNQQEPKANFEFRFLNSSGGLLETQVKNIKLKQEFEYIDENDNLAKKTIEGEKIVVVIRTNYIPAMSTLQIYHLSDLNNPISIISLPKTKQQ